MATFLRTRAVFSAPASGGDALLTYYWDSAGGTPTQVMTEAVARVRAFWESFKAKVPNTATITYDGLGDEVEETTGEIVGQFTATPLAVTNGLAGTDILPYQTQGLLRLSTGTYIGGRRVQGRQFLPVPLEADSSGGVPVGAYVTAVQTAAALLGTTVVTPIAQRVWHRPGPGGPGLSVVVTGRSCSTQWAVLRSRRA